MKRTWLAVAALFFTSLGSAATTGGLVGRVVDADGTELPGVTVTVESPSLIGGARTVVTDSGGAFVFAAVPPGVYSLRADLAGFAPRVQSGILVELDRTTTLTVTLGLEAFEDEIEVTGESPVVNTSSASLGQNYRGEYLELTAVGSSNRDFQATALQTAGIRLDPATADLSVFGSTGGENSYYIDGLATTDVATQGFGGNLNFDAIEEVAVHTAGYEAEYGYAIGGVVNLITKSGGNELSGSVDARYRDDGFNESGDHFDPDDESTTFQNVAATLGGPVVRDRLWFFLSAERLDADTTPAGALATREQGRTGLLGKATWQASSGWRVVGKVNSEGSETDNVFASPFVEPAAEGRSESSVLLAQVEALGMLSDALVLNLQLGTTESEVDFAPQSGDLETFAHQDLVTGVSSQNYINAQYSDRERTQAKADLTWLLDGLAGSHELKVGLDVSETEFAFDSFLPGSFAYLDLAGAPYALVEQVRPRAVRTTDGSFRTGFVQDAWRPHADVTIKLGVRWDQATYDDRDGQEVADLAKLQPRLGLVWDVLGDGTTVARGFAGRFMHPSGLTLPNSLEGPFTGIVQYVNCLAVFPDVATCQAVADMIGSRVIGDPGDAPGVSWFLSGDLGGQPGRIDPGLDPAYADQYVLGIERKIARATSIGLEYVRKDTEDLFESTCNGNWPGPPSADAACDYPIVANLPPLERSYRGWILSLETRALESLHLMASYVYSDSEGSLEYSQSDSPEFDIYPQNWVNRDGYLSTHRQHQVKVNGYWLLPAQFSLGFTVDWTSAFRWTPRDATTVPVGEEFVEPRGSRSGDSFAQVDLQLSKTFALGPVDLTLIGSVLNLLDSENGTAVCEYVTGCGGTLAPGATTAWQQPRHYELGARLTF